MGTGTLRGLSMDACKNQRLPTSYSGGGGGGYFPTFLPRPESRGKDLIKAGAATRGLDGAQSWFGGQTECVAALGRAWRWWGRSPHRQGEVRAA